MRKLEDIVPPSRRKEGEPSNKPSFGDVPRPARFPYTTMIIVLAVIAVSIGALFYFGNAKVEVTPSTISTAVQNSFTASQSTGDLPFEIVTAQKIATQSVQGSGTKSVKSSASGIFTIYNTQAKSQKLIANTRFATSAGLIFRIHTAVTVPSGTKASPGSIKTTAYADQPGASYNVGPTSFTIPGLAGTPQSDQVYARSTSSMIGGASGTVPVVDAAIESTTKSALQTALAPDLVASIKTQVPPGYVLLPGASSTTYEELAPAPSSSTGMVDVKVQGTVTAIIFPNEALAKAVAKSVPGMNYQGEALTLVKTDDLALTAAGGLPDPSAVTFTFTLAGTAPFIYSINSARIAAAVAGKTRSAAEVALTNYPEVKRAIIILRPFWKQTFPDDPASISVVVMKP